MSQVRTVRAFLAAATSCGLMANAAVPDAGVARVEVTVCDASACGEPWLRARNVEEVSVNLGMKPAAAAPTGATPVKVSPSQPIHLAVGERRFIRLPCQVSRFAMGNTPWDITSTGSPTDFILQGMSPGRSPLVAWCSDQTRRVFEVVVDAPSTEH